MYLNLSDSSYRFTISPLMFLFFLNKVSQRRCKILLKMNSDFFFTISNVVQWQSFNQVLLTFKNCNNHTNTGIALGCTPKQLHRDPPKEMILHGEKAYRNKTGPNALNCNTWGHLITCRHSFILLQCLKHAAGWIVDKRDVVEPPTGYLQTSLSMLLKQRYSLCRRQRERQVLAL